MRVLVTGGAGFIGLATARALRDRGDDVRLLDALTQPVHTVDSKGPEGFDFVRGDVRAKNDWVRALNGIDAVVHCAAYQDYLPDFSTFFSVNAAGTALLYEVIVERNVDIRRVVVSSTQGVYGEGPYHCERDGVVFPLARPAAQLEKGDWEQRCPTCDGFVEPIPASEEHANPRNSYGISKLAGERAALALGETYGIPTAALRYSIVHGAGQSPRNAYSGLLRGAALRLLAGLAPIVFEDGRQRRDYVAIEDVVAANLVALDHPAAPGDAYNVGGGSSMTVLEMLAHLGEITGIDIRPEIPGTFRVGDTRHIESDVSRLRALGWEPRADLEDVWRRYWDWLGSIDIDAAVAGRAYDDMIARGVLRRTR